MYQPPGVRAESCGQPLSRSGQTGGQIIKGSDGERVRKCSSEGRRMGGREDVGMVEREGGHVILGRKEQKVASGKARLLSPVDQRAEPSC